MRSNGNSDIPGAPNWVRHFLQRVDDRFDVFEADLEMAVREFRSVAPRVTELEERVRKAEAEIVELKRSLTPPGGFAATIPAPSGPPDEAA